MTIEKSRSEYLNKNNIHKGKWELFFPTSEWKIPQDAVHLLLRITPLGSANYFLYTPLNQKTIKIVSHLKILPALMITGRLTWQVSGKMTIRNQTTKAHAGTLPLYTYQRHPTATQSICCVDCFAYEVQEERWLLLMKSKSITFKERGVTKFIILKEMIHFAFCHIFLREVIVITVSKSGWLPARWSHWQLGRIGQSQAVQCLSLPLQWARSSSKCRASDSFLSVLYIIR